MCRAYRKTLWRKILSHLHAVNEKCNTEQQQQKETYNIWKEHTHTHTYKNMNTLNMCACVLFTFILNERMSAFCTFYRGEFRNEYVFSSFAGAVRCGAICVSVCVCACDFSYIFRAFSFHKSFITSYYITWQRYIPCVPCMYEDTCIALLYDKYTHLILNGSEIYTFEHIQMPAARAALTSIYTVKTSLRKQAELL